tara:strand:- start:39024 stop:39977 length:954 start_codon:yes stop_codon:yes gene_type:complete
MSNFYTYNFISPESIYATVKEELKSYFDTGAIDDLMFPTYLDKCLKKLGKSSYTIVPTPLEIVDFEARLPDNFYAVREAWMCVEIPLRSYQDASSFYSQAASATTIQISPVTYGGTPCTNLECTTGCPECMPELIQAVYKTNTQTIRNFRQSYLLKPGNISAREKCDVAYSSNLEQYRQQDVPYGSTYNSFDIRNNMFVTNFRNGMVHLIMYATDYDEIGNQLVPDNYRIREFIEAFIKYKVFETLTNQVNDETFNQLQQKLVYYKSLADEAYIMAQMEIQKQDVYTKQQRIKQQLNRLNMYELPSGTVRYGRRRNN